MAERIRKETRGFPKFASVRLPSRSGKTKTIIVAEGLETAVSIWVAVDYELEVWSVGGKQFLNYVKPPANTKTLILFADNDDDKADNGRRHYNSVARRAPTKTYIARPEQPGWDANDFFRRLPQGQAIEAIRQTILNSIKE